MGSLSQPTVVFRLGERFRLRACARDVAKLIALPAARLMLSSPLRQTCSARLFTLTFPVPPLVTEKGIRAYLTCWIRVLTAPSLEVSANAHDCRPTSAGLHERLKLKCPRQRLLQVAEVCLFDVDFQLRIL